VSDIRWEGYSHEEIYGLVHTGPGRNVSTPAEAVWADTASLILRVDQRIAEAMAQSGSGWEGSAADATRNAMSPLGQWALDAANDAGITARAVTGQGEQARDLRNAMPEPNAAQRQAAFHDALTDPTYIFRVGDMHALDQEAANRAARAVDLMNTYTSNSYENRRNMDYWTLPPQVTVETTSPASVAAASSVPAVAAPPGGGVVGPVGGPAATPGGSGAGAGGVLVGEVPSVVGAGAGGSGTGGAGAGPGADGGGAARGGSAGLGSAPGGAVAGLRPGAARVGGGPARAGTTAGGASGPGATRSRGGSAGGVRPVVPGLPPRSAPGPSWRDIVPGADQERALPPPGGSRFPSESLGRGPAGGERPGTGVADPQPRGTAPRSTVMGHAGLYPPVAAGGIGGQDREHRRPDYLVDDTDAFADDRWFTPPVITPDDGPPLRR
jgi:hypothetical protein